MTKVDFFALPRAVQERVIGGIEGQFPPTPILRKRPKAKPPWLWLGVSAASFLAVLILHRIGFGSLDSTHARQSVPTVFAYTVLVFGMMFGLFGALGSFVRLSRLPYRSGIYVYASRLLDASSHPIRSYYMAELNAVAPRGNEIVITFADREFSFDVDPALAASVVEELERARGLADAAAEASDPNALLEYDPLHEPRFANPVGSQDPLTYDIPPWVRYAWAYAAVIGLVLGPTFWFLRNFASDGALYTHAVALNTPEAYRAYLASGSRYKEEVSGVLLPKAELSSAVQADTVESILAFEAAHKDSKINAEIESAKKTAYSHELSRAKAKKTIAALREFEKKYPKHGLGAEYTNAVHALYESAKDEYASLSGPLPKDAAQALRRLIAILESKGPAVDFRMRRRLGATLARVDKAIGKAPEYMGEISRPTRYFDEQHSKDREAKLSAGVLTAFSARFPKELLSLREGELVLDTPLPTVTSPTLFLTHLEDWSGHSYTTKKPRGVFIGIFFNFEIELLLPGEGSIYKTKFGVFRPLPSALLKELESAPRTEPPIEEKIYEFMAEEARGQIQKRIESLFLAARH